VPVNPDAEASPDDVSVGSSDGLALLKDALGATVITEFEQ